MLTSMDLTQIDMVACRQLAQTATEESLASASRECTRHRLERQVVRLPDDNLVLSTVNVDGVQTMRELGNTFQLRRRPSRSSTSEYCSFNASTSMLTCVNESVDSMSGYLELCAGSLVVGLCRKNRQLYVVPTRELSQIRVCYQVHQGDV